MENLDSLRSELMTAVAAEVGVADRAKVRDDALGRNGRITALMKTLGKLDAETRRTTGAALNALKDEVAAALDARKAGLADEELSARLKNERVDVTLPIRPEPEGRIHPISQTVDEVIAIFGEMGFKIAEG